VPDLWRMTDVTAFMLLSLGLLWLVVVLSGGLESAR